MRKKTPRLKGLVMTKNSKLSKHKKSANKTGNSPNGDEEKEKEDDEYQMTQHSPTRKPSPLLTENRKDFVKKISKPAESVEDI